MQELINIFKDGNILILAIVIIILSLILLVYLLSGNTNKKPKKQAEVKQVVKEENQDKKSLDLEEMLGKMQESLDRKNKMDEVSRYESEQEENAIISYQELLKAARKDFPQMKSEEVLEPEVLKVEKPKEEKKFKNSVFISPIYGTKGNYKEESSVDTDIKKDDLEYENEMNEQFLNDLKKFRSNL